MKSENNSKTRATLHQLFSKLGKTGTGVMILATIVIIGAGYLANVPFVLLGQIVDMIINSSSDTPWVLFGFIIACLIGRVILILMQKYLVERTAVRIQKSIFMENVEKVMSVRVDAFQHMRIGEMTVRLDKRVQGIVRLLKLIFLEALPQVAVAIPALILAFLQHEETGFVMLGVLLLSIFVTTVQIISQRGIRIWLINKTAVLAGHVAELLGHLDYVRATGMRKRTINLFEQETESIRKTEFRHHKWMMSFDAVKGLFEEGGMAVVVGTGIYFAAQGEMTPGTILTLAMLYKSAAQPLQNLHRIVDELYESMLQIDAASDIVEAKNDLGLTGAITPVCDITRPVVKACNLSLHRRTHDGQKNRVLNNLSFEFYPGEVIGIAGPSGSGKSSLLQVMLGLFPDYQGELKMFGDEVRSLLKSDLADYISYGPQKPFVQAGSVRANVTNSVIQKGELTDKLIRESLSRAQFNVDLDKELSERGDNISPGQAQRLSLARIFAKIQSRLIILDEATSMLDGATQKKVIEEVRKQAAGRVVIMVAHRLDTLSWADRILVLDDGQIVQDGSYNDLASKPGVFTNLLGKNVTLLPMAKASSF